MIFIVLEVNLPPYLSWSAEFLALETGNERCCRQQVRVYTGIRLGYTLGVRVYTVYLSTCLFVYLYICVITADLSTCLSVYLSACLPVYLSCILCPLLLIRVLLRLVTSRYGIAEYPSSLITYSWV